ncbi:universal stress protein [Thermomonospora catenispora]|uniref:universal stress protein n=1 Tax=Thermomonospora catenispora TaxID=2493090 RepID=UPI00111E62D1|nr:universal stress protein [Thermomonospora catenispora]TNY35912.1 universal stress protein [Thermomonospora catenispora]
MAQPSRPSAAPVVVGTDGSPGAGHAVAWAADEAALRDRPLRILHAVQTWGMGTAVMVGSADLLASLENAGRLILEEAERLARRRRPGLEVDAELVAGSPEQALRERADSAFEIVVGSHGVGGFVGLLLGSTGLHVAGHIPGPVVIVRGEADASHGEVVVGIDPTVEGEAVLEYAFEAAALRRARLRAVHGWRPPARIVDELDADRTDESLREAVEQAAAPLRERHPEVETAVDIVRDHPVHALTLASQGADLVVVGSHDRRGLRALRLGSVSHGIIHHAHCPVAIVRPRTDSRD